MYNVRDLHKVECLTDAKPRKTDCLHFATIADDHFDPGQDDDSDIDNNNTFAFEGNSDDDVDDEQFGFGAGSGDEMIEHLIGDSDLVGDLADGHDIEDGDHQGDIDEGQVPIFDPADLGLKEINNLARFRVSTYKPGNGVQELLSDDLDKYWQ